MEKYWIFLFGLIPQSLFSARMFIQWFLSEKTQKVVSPVIYWQLSLIASFLFLIYGWLRADFAIILGQLFSYYIYIWNLNILHRWKNIHRFIRVILIITPTIVISMLAITVGGDMSHLWKDITFGLLLFGTAGQLIFAFRFVYQWLYSRRLSESILPDGFWILSIVGSISILTYGIIRLDPILILSHSVGSITYARNLFLNRKELSRNSKKH